MLKLAGGYSPYNAVLGRVPNFLQEVGATSAQTHDGVGEIGGVTRHVTRLRELALSSIVEAVARQRMLLAERTKTRVPVESLSLQPGQLVEIWRAPSSKDVTGWR